MKQKTDIVDKEGEHYYYLSVMVSYSCCETNNQYIDFNWIFVDEDYRRGNDPATYRFLPPYLINNPQEVTKVLGEINQPKAFIEVLTGEAWEDLRKSKKFLSNNSGALPTRSSSR